MSLKRICYHSVSNANVQLGGARASRATRTRHGRAFVDFCLSQRFPIADIRDIRTEWLKSWIQQLQLAGNGTGTINNKVSSVRSLSQARRSTKIIEIYDKAAIGLEKRSRVGKKSPVTDSVFEKALELALALGEEGFAHMLRLERYLGLRGLEALMSIYALKVYARQAAALLTREEGYIHIQDGTKGGRPRDVAVINKYAAETYQAIIAALKYAECHNGLLLAGKPNSGLKGARQKYHRLAAKCGLIGEFAPHCLRYRYCTDKLIELRDAGYPRSEALAFASSCLGHGPSRGRFVSSVYGRTVVHLMPKSTRLQNIRAAIESLEFISDEL